LVLTVPKVDREELAMRIACHKEARPGATIVEAAIVLTVFLMLVLCMIDIAIEKLRLHILSEAARQGARAAIVHGSRAKALGPWGPGQYGPALASSSDPQAQAIAPFLAGIDPSTVNVTYQWLDGSNAAKARVCVTLTNMWTPIVQSFLGNDSYTLSASSTMPIAH
jgi:Flp pilus assembly protein TadG